MVENLYLVTVMFFYPNLFKTLKRVECGAQGNERHNKKW